MWLKCSLLYKRKKNEQRNQRGGERLTVFSCHPGPQWAQWSSSATFYNFCCNCCLVFCVPSQPHTHTCVSFVGAVNAFYLGVQWPSTNHTVVVRATVKIVAKWEKVEEAVGVERRKNGWNMKRDKGQGRSWGGSVYSQLTYWMVKRWCKS